MRLGFDGTSLLHARTGIGVFAYETIQRLGRRDDLDVCAFAVSWRRREQLALHVPPQVRVVRRPMAARPLQWAWARGDRPPVEWWTGALDVVFGPNFVVPPARDAAEVVTVHDLTVLRFPELCTPDTLRYPHLIRRAVSRGAFIHAVSEAMAEEIRDAFGVPADRVVTVPNGYTPPPAADPAAGRALAGAERYILGLGTIEPRKDFPTLIAAFDALAAADRELHLVVAGPDGWGLPAFDAAAASARHRDRIVRLGWLEDADRAALLRGARVFAYPSIYEGFGLPPLEAMAAGVPVVCSSAGALPDTVGDAATLVPPGDVDALAAALALLLDDEPARRGALERAPRNLERFSWDRTAGGLTALFHRAHAERHGARP